MLFTTLVFQYVSNFKFKYPFLGIFDVVVTLIVRVDIEFTVVGNIDNCIPYLFNQLLRVPLLNINVESPKAPV